jgi:hypothetical protein
VYFGSTSFQLSQLQNQRFAIGSVFRGLDRGMEMVNCPVFAESYVKQGSFLKTEN